MMGEGDGWEVGHLAGARLSVDEDTPRLAVEEVSDSSASAALVYLLLAGVLLEDARECERP